MARAQASATLAIIERFIARKLQRRYTAVKQDSPLAATLLGYPRLGPFRPTILTIMLERSWMVKKVFAPDLCRSIAAQCRLRACRTPRDGR
jgi:hypothetical protein